MTPTQRGILILFFSFIAVLIIVKQAFGKASRERKAYTYLLLLSFMFPLLDLKIIRGGYEFSVFNCVTLAYFLCNIKSVFTVAKKYYLIIVLALVMVLTSFFSEFPILSLGSIPNRLKGFVVFCAAIILFSNCNQGERNKLLRKYIRYPIMFTIVWGAIQVFVNPQFTLFYSVWSKEARISSCYLDPQIAGCCIATLILIVWNIYMSQRKTFFLITIVCLAVVGLYSGSKAFILGTLVGIISNSIFVKNKTKFIFALFLMSLILVFTYDSWSQMLIFERLMDVESSMSGRNDFYWAFAMMIFYNNWFTGIGTGAFTSYIEKYRIPMVHEVEGFEIYAVQPESGYLLWLDELGVFSVIWLVIILYLFLKKRGSAYINISCVVPWLVAFVSLYNLSSMMLVFLLFMTVGLIIVESPKDVREISVSVQK